MKFYCWWVSVSVNTSVQFHTIHLTSRSQCRTRSLFIYIVEDGLQYRLRLGCLSYAEIGSRDLSPSLSNVECSAYYNVAIGFGIRIRVHLVNVNEPSVWRHHKARWGTTLSRRLFKIECFQYVVEVLNARMRWTNRPTVGKQCIKR